MSNTAIFRSRNARDWDGRIATCSRGDKDCHIALSSTTGTGIPEGKAIYGGCRVLRNKFIKFPEYGKLLTPAEIDQLNIETGRAVPYVRNGLRFIMSRAARKRGYTNEDYVKLVERKEKHRAYFNKSL